MGFLNLAIAAFFLWNPFYQIIDIFPDFIGYAFILIALHRMQIFNDNLEDANHNFYRLLWVSVIKFSLPFVLKIVGDFSANLALLNDGIMQLLYTATFALIEGYLLFSAFSQLFKGFDVLGRYDEHNTLLYKSAGIRKFTLFFVVMRSVLSVFPEILSLSATNSSYVTLYTYDISKFKTFFLIFSISHAAWIGIFWLAMFCAYIRRITRDADLMQSLQAEYEHRVAEYPAYFFKRKTKTAINLIVAGLIFCIHIHLYYFNIVPSFIGTGFILAAFLILHKEIICSRKIFIAEIILEILSIVCYVVQVRFVANLHYNFRITEAEIDFYKRLSAVNDVVLALIMSALFSLIFVCLYRFLQRYGDKNDTDYELSQQRIKSSAAFLIGMSVLQTCREMFAEQLRVLSFISLAYSVFANFWAVSACTAIYESVSRGQSRFRKAE